jgi:hypothetical protein
MKISIRRIVEIGLAILFSPLNLIVIFGFEVNPSGVRMAKSILIIDEKSKPQTYCLRIYSYF